MEPDGLGRPGTRPQSGAGGKWESEIMTHKAKSIGELLSDYDYACSNRRDEVPGLRREIEDRLTAQYTAMEACRRFVAALDSGGIKLLSAEAAGIIEPARRAVVTD